MSRWAQLSGPSGDFGVIVASHPGDLRFAKGCCYSIRRSMGDVPICLLFDGHYESMDLTDIYGVSVMNRRDVANDQLRKCSFGWGLSKMTAFWESPYTTFLLLDADTVVCGDVRRYVDFAVQDLLVDCHMRDFARSVGVNPHLERLLGRTPGACSVRVLRLIRDWFFDPAELARVFPGLDWRDHIDGLFCSGVLFGRRGIFDLGWYLELLEVAGDRPGLFGPGEMGLLNFMVLHALQEGLITVGREARLQTLACQHSADELQAKCRRNPSDVPTVIHWSGRPKPDVASGPFGALMTAARLGFLTEFGCSPREAYARLLQEDAEGTAPTKNISSAL